MPVAPSHPSLVVSLSVVALVVWRLYSRVRRMIGRQQLSRWRPWITVVLFPLILALLSFFSIAHPINLVTLLVGVVFGSTLGVYGLRLTKFEETQQGLFYTPSAHLGIALSLLFAGRVVYRLAQFYTVMSSTPSSSTEFMRSPLTLAIFSALAGYYITYAIGLLRWSKRTGALVQLNTSEQSNA